MATKKSNESIDEKAFQALEAALKIDFDELASSPNDKTSLDDPEENVSQPTNQAATPDQNKKARPQPEQSRGARAAEAAKTLAPEPAPKSPSLSAANDDGRRSPAAMLRALDVRSNRAAIRVAALVSVIWAVAGLGVANLLYGPQIWQIRSLSDLAATLAPSASRSASCCRSCSSSPLPS